MRIFTRKVLVQALALGLITEAACFSLMIVGSGKSAVFRIADGFHQVPGAVMSFVVPGLEDESAIPQDLDADVAVLVFFATALLQWFIVFWGGHVLFHRISRAKHEITPAA